METLILKAYANATGRLPKADQMSIRVFAGTDKSKILPLLAGVVSYADTVRIEGGVFVQQDFSETTSQNFNPGGYNNLNVKVTEEVAYIYFPALGGNLWRFKEYIDANNPPRTPAQPRIDYTSRMYALGDVQSMFESCTTLVNSISGLDLKNCYNFNNFFASALRFNQDVHRLNIRAVTASVMFAEAWSFNGRVDNIVGTQTVAVDGIFRNAYSFNQPLTGWNLINCYNTQSMFAGATSFDQDISQLNYNYESNFGSFLDGSGLSPTNYDKFLIMLDGMDFSLRTQPKVMSAYGVKYSSNAALAARNSLVAKGWTIYDGGKS
ncbi:hypothetical protein AL492_17690 [Elizabethkingia anophelis]|uniref:BspA family leucine-rich repeat surface protein n=1 Tax=Elizabethkingia anophelis TaxID=1117645 RepID=UPI000CE9A01C|nr:BspA family leucine-rich repeat surface protein [Elizabethkingia anophelis]AVF49356.1 hypothetical protein AL491_15285 [Elizabethkingia anophelis]AVF53351.1 hypothetical protein AL492_17690 [Elizabethkingia anophelis]